MTEIKSSHSDQNKRHGISRVFCFNMTNRGLEPEVPKCEAFGWRRNANGEAVQYSHWDHKDIPSMSERYVFSIGKASCFKIKHIFRGDNHTFLFFA